MEKIFDIAKDSEQKWGTLATAIDGNFEEQDRRNYDDIKLAEDKLTAYINESGKVVLSPSWEHILCPLLNILESWQMFIQIIVLFIR